MIQKLKAVIAVVIAIFEAAKSLAAYVQTEGNGEAKKAFVMGAFDVLFSLDDELFGGIVGKKLTQAADKAVELVVALDKALGGMILKQAKEQIGADITGNS